MHLTNYSINKHSDDFVESEDFLNVNKASKRTFQSLFTSLKNQGIDVDKLKYNI